LKATIYKSTGSFYLAQDTGGRLWKCRIRGKLKIDKEISSTNPVAVGDQVTLLIEDEADATAVITDIGKRDNYIVRTSPHNKHQKHIVAANLDQALITITIHSPRTSIGFIDRFLVTAEAYHIPAILVFNKADLLEGDFREEWQYRKNLYEKIGYRTFTCTATDGTGLEELKQQLLNRTTLFSGHSGVGKSTLINNLIPDKNLKVKEISDWSGKGQHTTTFAEMFDLPGGGRIIDTPGVKEFGIVGFDRYDLAHYFPEMRDRMSECRFNNCVHANEPGCAIKDAVMAGDISSERYESYLVMLADL
jgi:ribosome biogenesis GTPase